MRVLQRAPPPDRPRRAAGPVVDLEANYEPAGDARQDFDDLQGFEQGDDEPAPVLEADEADDPGYCVFSTPSRDFPPDLRVAAAPPGSNMHWDPELRCFGKPPSTATNYDYFMHFFDHEFFKNGVLAHTQASSPSLLITEDELWTFLALRMVMACHPSIAVVDFFYAACSNSHATGSISRRLHVACSFQSTQWGPPNSSPLRWWPS